MTVPVLLLGSIYEVCHVELSLMIPILISHRRISNRIASLTVVHSISRRSFICNPQPGETQSIWPMIEVVQRVSLWRSNESHMLRAADRCFEHRIWCITRAVFWTNIGLFHPVVAPLSRRLAAHIAERCATAAAHSIACVFQLNPHSASLGRTDLVVFAPLEAFERRIVRVIRHTPVRVIRRIALLASTAELA